MASEQSYKNHTRWFPPLLARLTVGFVFAESGWGKLHNIPKVVGYFTDLGIPAPEFQAHLVASTELVGGTLLLLGLLTRLASVPLTVVMTVAIITAKRADLNELSDLFGFSEYLYIVLLIWLLISGAGFFSMDTLIAKKYKQHYCS